MHIGLLGGKRIIIMFIFRNNLKVSKNSHSLQFIQKHSKSVGSQLSSVLQGSHWRYLHSLSSESERDGRSFY